VLAKITPVTPPVVKRNKNPKIQRAMTVEKIRAP
jgi:hypothetical protein